MIEEGFRILSLEICAQIHHCEGRVESILNGDVHVEGDSVDVPSLLIDRVLCDAEDEELAYETLTLRHELESYKAMFSRKIHPLYILACNNRDDDTDENPREFENYGFMMALPDEITEIGDDCEKFSEFWWKSITLEHEYRMMVDDEYKVMWLASQESEYVHSCKLEICELAEEIIGEKFGILFGEARFDRYHLTALDAVGDLEIESIGCASHEFRTRMETALDCLADSGSLVGLS